MHTAFSVRRKINDARSIDTVQDPAGGGGYRDGGGSCCGRVRRQAALNLVRDDAPGSAIERARVCAMLEASPDDARVLREALTGRMKTLLGRKGKCTPTRNLPTTGAMGLPVPQPHAPHATYEAQKFHLQVELLKLQAWVGGNRPACGHSV